MKYIKIADWDEFQAYKDDRPMHWIKLHKKLLRSRRFNKDLTEIEQLQLIKLWLLAAEKGNEMEWDEEWIRTEIRTKKPISMDKFISLGYITMYEKNGDDVKDCTDSYESVPRVDKSRVDKSRVDKKQKFLEFIFLTDEEYKKLVDKFGKDRTDGLIQDLNDDIGSKGYKYKSHYHTILQWSKRKFGNGGNVKPDICCVGCGATEGLTWQMEAKEKVYRCPKCWKIRKGE